MDKLNQWLGLVANIGVLIGVFVVVYELRQNTSVSAAQAAFEVNALVDASYRARAQDPRLARLVEDGHNSPDALEDLERLQFYAWLRADINATETVWFYYKNGQIAEEDFGGFRNAICSRLTTPGGKLYWKEEALFFAEGFRESVNVWCFKDISADA